MKKKYMAPTVVVVKFSNNQHLLTTSESINAGTMGIDYGGVDDGTITPAAREFDVWWDD